jgi:hypothetical protein
VNHSLWWLLVDALAIYRLTRLVTVDTLTDPARKRLLDAAKRIAFDVATSNMNRPTPVTTNGYGRLWELVTCPWCISVWIAVPVVALTRLAPVVWQYPALTLALAAVAGIVSERL